MDSTVQPVKKWPNSRLRKRANQAELKAEHIIKSHSVASEPNILKKEQKSKPVTDHQCPDVGYCEECITSVMDFFYDMAERRKLRKKAEKEKLAAEINQTKSADEKTTSEVKNSTSDVDRETVVVENNEIHTPEIKVAPVVVETEADKVAQTPGKIDGKNEEQLVHKLKDATSGEQMVSEHGAIMNAGEEPEPVSIISGAQLIPLDSVGPSSEELLVQENNPILREVQVLITDIIKVIETEEEPFLHSPDEQLVHKLKDATSGEQMVSEHGAIMNAGEEPEPVSITSGAQLIPLDSVGPSSEELLVQENNPISREVQELITDIINVIETGEEAFPQNPVDTKVKDSVGENTKEATAEEMMIQHEVEIQKKTESTPERTGEDMVDGNDSNSSSSRMLVPEAIDRTNTKEPIIVIVGERSECLVPVVAVYASEQKGDENKEEHVRCGCLYAIRKRFTRFIRRFRRRR